MTDMITTQALQRRLDTRTKPHGSLGLVEATPDEKKSAARVAMLASRFNTMFSVPMLYFMVAAQNIY